MKNIHLLPTEDNSWLCLKDGELVNANDGGCMLGYDPPRWLTQHLYITSSEEIKEGDWILKCSNVNDWNFKSGELQEKDYSYFKVKCVSLVLLNPEDKKIILTTNPTLIADGVQEINNEFLEWFMKNDTCEFVEVNSLGICNPDTDDCGHYEWEYDLPQEESKYVFGTAKGEYTIGITSPNTAKGEYAIGIGFNPETANTAYAHHSIVIGNGLTTTEPYQLLVDRNGIKIDKIMTIEEYELLSQVLKSINDIKF